MTEEWIEIIAEEGGVPAGPVYEVEKALNSPRLTPGGRSPKLTTPSWGRCR